MNKRQKLAVSNESLAPIIITDDTPFSTNTSTLEAVPLAIANWSQKEEEATRKPFAMDEVSASPKVITIQNIETTPLAGYPSHLGARKA